ncbi:HD domain-containing protein [Chloroflexi bacterium TSY]|nr:HD domain-containing protein [Chloroflexi bacterium TSY]
MDLEQAQKYVLQRLHKELPTHCTYHNVGHTVEEVLPVAQHYAKLIKISEIEQLLLETAALFHDLGFIYRAQGHEEIGAQIAAEVLPDMGYGPDHIDQIQQMIRATHYPQSPHTILDAILCDADLDVLGREKYLDRSQQLRQELALTGQTMSDASWYSKQWAFLYDHHYHTSVAQELRNAGKNQNQHMLFQQITTLHSNGKQK